MYLHNVINNEKRKIEITPTKSKESLLLESFTAGTPTRAINSKMDRCCRFTQEKSLFLSRSAKIRDVTIVGIQRWTDEDQPSPFGSHLSVYRTCSKLGEVVWAWWWRSKGSSLTLCTRSEFERRVVQASVFIIVVQPSIGGIQSALFRFQVETQRKTNDETREYQNKRHGIDRFLLELMPDGVRSEEGLHLITKENTDQMVLVESSPLTEEISAGLEEMFCPAQSCFRSIDRYQAMVGTLEKQKKHQSTFILLRSWTDWERKDAWSSHWPSMRWKISSNAWHEGEQALEPWITFR